MPLMSPQTQAMANPGMSEEHAKVLFEQGFSQMAYDVLMNKLPHLASDVITFKLLDSAYDTGAGVGAFVVDRSGQMLYIPVVMADNQIKPLDIMYFKDLNIFLPLGKEWLKQVDRLSMEELGGGVETPDTLPTDVDIRNTVVPPTTGRYSYAAEIESVACVFDEARHQTDPKLAFLSFLKEAPASVKTAAARLFEARPALLKHAVYYYGGTPLIEALEQTKTADYGARMSRTGGLYIADKTTSPAEFADTFGEKAPVAYSGVALKGYFAKDDRKDLKHALRVQPELRLHEPHDAGGYRLWKKDGKAVDALIIGNPVDLFVGPAAQRVPPRNIRFRQRKVAPAVPEQGYGKNTRMPGRDGTKQDVFSCRYVGVTADGKLVDADCLMGEPTNLAGLKQSKVYKYVVGEGEPHAPKTGETGIFIAKRGTSFMATTPATVKSVTTDSSGVRRVTVQDTWGDTRTLITDPSCAHCKLTFWKKDKTVYLPASYSWVPTKGKITSEDLHASTAAILQIVSQGLEKQGALVVGVKKAADRGWTFGSNSTREYSFVPALRKLAEEAHIAVEDAEHALKAAAERGWYEFWVADNDTILKVAATIKQAQPAPPEEDPAGMAMEQVEPQPPPPSPVDMAVAEAMQNLMMQHQALQQQAQMLEQLQMRAQMISQGMGGEAAAASMYGGPMDPSMMGAGAPAGGMDPNMMGGMDPNMMGGMDPNMMGGGMDPGMDPNMMEQQQGALMTATEDPDPEALLSQVNPEFMEQAGALDDAGAFDAAALSSLAQSPALKELVTTYLPNLEKSLDNIGRVLLTLWMAESDVKEDIGTETYVGLEDNLRTVFRGLGELILKISQNTLVLRDPNEAAIG